MQRLRLLQSNNHGKAGDWVLLQEETAQALLANNTATLEDEDTPPDLIEVEDGSRDGE